MIWDLFELRTQNQNQLFFLNNMLSDSQKSAIKMTLEDPQKNIAKKYKNMKLSGFFSEFWGLNYPSNQFFNKK